MENKKKLLSLIKELSLPLTEEEVVRVMDNLSEEEVELLLIKTEVVKKHLAQIDEEAKKVDPAAHKDMKKKLEKDLYEIEESYLDDMEKIQKAYDERMYKTEEEARRNIEKIVDKYKSDVNGIKLLHDEIYKKINELIDTGKPS